jgi:hypothetical protein
MHWHPQGNSHIAKQSRRQCRSVQPLPTVSLLACFAVCRKMPTPVKPDKQLFLGRLCVPGRPVPPLLASLMPPRLIRSAMEAAGEQPPQQQQQLAPLDSTGGAAGRIGGCGAAAAAAGAAAVADGGLDGLLQAGDSCLDTPFDAAAAVGQHSDQQQKQPKRLGGLRPLDDAQTSKKPRTVAASSFGAPTTGSLAGVSGRFHRLVRFTA